MITQYTILRKCKKAVLDGTGVHVSTCDCFGYTPDPYFGYHIWLPEENPHPTLVFNFYPAKTLKVSDNRLINVFSWILNAKIIYVSHRYNKIHTMKMRVYHTMRTKSRQRIINPEKIKHYKLVPFWSVNNST